MTMPSWMTKLAAAAVIPFALGAGIAVSAPSATVESEEMVAALDEAYVPGALGVDYSIITGPSNLQPSRLPACADPARRGELRECLK